MALSDKARLLAEEDQHKLPTETAEAGRRSVRLSFKMKFLTLPVTVVCGFLSTYLGISYVGAGSFGAILLITGLIQFLPFADLGVGAVVMNAMSRGLKVREAERLLVSAQRLLLVSGGIIALMALGLTLTNLWTVLLGPGVLLVESPAVTACAFLVGYGFAVIFQIGLRVMMGRGKNHYAIAISSMASVFALATTALTVATSGPVIWLVLAPVIGLMATGIIACSIALSGTGMSYWRIIALSMRPGFYRGVSISNTAVPMLIVMLGLALSLQAQKLILSHFGSIQDLAEYGVAGQIYSQAWAALASILIVYWRRFNGERESGGKLSEFYPIFWRSVRRVSIAGLGVAIVLGFVVWVGSDLISHGQSRASLSLSVALGLLLWIQATHYLGGMLLTSPAGLRFQALCVTLMVFVAIPSSIVGVLFWGAAGAAWASLASVVLCQLIPTWIYVRRKTFVDVS